jgi:hypothetical protein
MKNALVSKLGVVAMVVAGAVMVCLQNAKHWKVK